MSTNREQQTRGYCHLTAFHLIAVVLLFLYEDCLCFDIFVCKNLIMTEESLSPRGRSRRYVCTADQSVLLPVPRNVCRTARWRAETRQWPESQIRTTVSLFCKLSICQNRQLACPSPRTSLKSGYCSLILLTIHSKLYFSSRRWVLAI